MSTHPDVAVDVNVLVSSENEKSDDDVAVRGYIDHENENVVMNVRKNHA